MSQERCNSETHFLNPYTFHSFHISRKPPCFLLRWVVLDHGKDILQLPHVAVVNPQINSILSTYLETFEVIHSCPPIETQVRLWLVVEGCWWVGMEWRWDMKMIITFVRKMRRSSWGLFKISWLGAYKCWRTWPFWKSDSRIVRMSGKNHPTSMIWILRWNIILAPGCWRKGIVKCTLPTR